MLTIYKNVSKCIDCNKIIEKCYMICYECSKKRDMEIDTIHYYSVFDGVKK